MMTFHEKRFSLNCILVLLVIFGALCTASAKTTASIEAGWRSMQPIPARMLLLMPREFSEYFFVYIHKEEEIQLPLGEQAGSQLQLLLRYAFTSMEVDQVPSRSAALDMLSHGDPRLARYDLVAIPRFETVSYRDKGPEFGFNVEISLEITPVRSRVMDEITGRGRASAPQDAFSPMERLTLAMSNSFDAIKDMIESRREAWTP